MSDTAELEWANISVELFGVKQERVVRIESPTLISDDDFPTHVRYGNVTRSSEKVL
jgi:hypothetical protein